MAEIVGLVNLSKDQILEEAKICYGNCQTIISIISDVTKQIDDSFNPATAMEEFDMMLQSLMFSQSVVDDDFCEAEKDFIKNIVKENQNDLFEVANIEGYEGLSWDKVFDMDITEQKKLAEKVNVLMNDFADHFVTPFAVLDAFTTQNTLKDISAELTNISILLAAVDGELLEEEIDAFQEGADELILGKWADIKGLTKLLDEEVVRIVEDSE